MTNFATSAVVVKSSVSTNQVVIGSNAKKFSEITKGDRSIGLKAEVTVVVGRSQVTTFTANKKNREAVKQKTSDIIDQTGTAFTPSPTRGRRCSQRPQNLA